MLIIHPAYGSYFSKWVIWIRKSPTFIPSAFRYILTNIWGNEAYMASNRSAFKKALFIGCFNPQNVLRRREAVSLTARNRDLDTEVTRIARTCLLLLSMKKNSFCTLSSQTCWVRWIQKQLLLHRPGSGQQMQRLTKLFPLVPPQIFVVLNTGNENHPFLHVQALRRRR